MATFISPGATVDYPTGVALVAGAVIVVNEMVGVVQRDTAANKVAALVVEGNIRFPKATGGGSALAQGVNVYWNAGASQAGTATGGGTSKLIGKVATAATDADTDVLVRKVA